MCISCLFLFEKREEEHKVGWVGRIWEELGDEKTQHTLLEKSDH